MLKAFFITIVFYVDRLDYLYWIVDQDPSTA